MIGFIGRLEEQKGSDILFEAIPKFIDQNVQIIALVSFMIPLFFSLVHITCYCYLKKVMLMSVVLSYLGNWQKIHGEAN